MHVPCIHNTSSHQGLEEDRALGRRKTTRIIDTFEGRYIVEEGTCPSVVERKIADL